MRHSLHLKDTGSYFRRARILVVDDDPSIVSFLSFSLKAEGFRVQTAHSAQETYPLLEGRAPDLIFLDIQLPLVDGFELCKQLRRHPKTQKTPILFITGYADHSTLNKTHLVGAQGLIEKPIMFDELLSEIIEVFNGRFAIPSRLKFAS